MPIPPHFVAFQSYLSPIQTDAEPGRQYTAVVTFNPTLVQFKLRCQSVVTVP